MRFSSYWLDTSEPFVGNSPDLHGGRCDVVVVGGGAMGSIGSLWRSVTSDRVIRVIRKSAVPTLLVARRLLQ
ncbi:MULTISPECIES: hypothetical protein [unclassified Paraburkholderia]|uniref:hypothetical protein n=1 Tax=unclassified Paraburkholderia TaxID=2615204 RepID=UPI000E2605B2|nr:MULTISPECIES: hypothetical protein [unclassified Paraburkholderia]REE23998.1 hypothetical protein B0G71_7291 [Paraburkholderia sp. BL27I4N3]RKR38118.1 hypothetical protein B0G82_6238 [Paraburkholderia sp. BL17N1]